MNKWLRKL